MTAPCVICKVSIQDDDFHGTHIVCAKLAVRFLETECAVFPELQKCMTAVTTERFEREVK